MKAGRASNKRSAVGQQRHLQRSELTLGIFLVWCAIFMSWWKPAFKYPSLHEVLEGAGGDLTCIKDAWRYVSTEEESTTPFVTQEVSEFVKG